MRSGLRAMLLLLFIPLAACGGGGSGSTPGVPIPVVTATAAATPTTAPPNPATSSTQVSAGYSAQMASLATIASGYAAALTVPGTSSTGVTLSLTLSASLPSGAPVVAIRHGSRHANAIGGNPSGFAYINMGTNASAAFATTPAVAFTLPGAPAAGTVLGLALYNPSQSASGWQLIEVASATGASVTFPPVTLPFSIATGAGCVFALVSSSALPTPTPPLTGIGVLQIDFTNVQVPSFAANSAIVTINGSALAPVRVSGNQVSVQAQSVSGAAVGIAVYNTTDGSGPALAFGSTTGSIIAAATSTTTVQLDPVLTSYTVTLNPTAVVVGTPTDVGIDIVPPPGISEAILGNTYVDANDAPVTFTATVLDSSGQTSVTKQPVIGTPGTLHYAGSGSGGANVTVVAGTLTAQASLSYNAHKDSFALAQYAHQYAGISDYLAGGSTPVWSTPNIYNSGYRGPVAFDAQGNLWADESTGFVGYSPTGVQLANSIPITTETLLTFDSSGLLYTAPANSASALNVYSLSASEIPTLVRTIPLTSAPLSAAVDASGNVYVETQGSNTQASGVYEFAPGATNPSVWNFTNVGPVATDGLGDVFVNLSVTIAEWPSGQAISSTPRTLISASVSSINFTSFAVTPSGDGCAVEVSLASGILVGWSAAGGNPTAVCPNVGVGDAGVGSLYATSYYLASPLR